MKNKNTAIIILISMILVNILGCQSATPKKAITADTPYYSVTIGSYEKSNNHYMNLDIELPRITYSNDSGSALIDPLNAEIETNLNQLINEAKDKALNTYETYIESAKTNAKNEVKNKVAKLKEKYKDILGEDELQLLSDFNVDDLETMHFRNGFRSTDSNIRWPFPKRATQNNVKKSFNKGTQNSSSNNNDNNENIHGFTNTEDIIIPGLHNKNIIIVETTTKESTEISSQKDNKTNRVAPTEGEQNSGKPNRDFDKSSDRQFNNNEIPNRKNSQATKSNANFDNQHDNTDNNIANSVVSIDIENKNQILTNKANLSTKSDMPQHSNIFIATDSNINLNNDITIENFYRELGKIYRTRIPNDMTLTMEYIPTTIHCNFEVKCLDEDYLSLFVQLSESRTTSSIKRLFYNVDLNQGKIINLKDILGEKFKENVVNVINGEIEKWTDEQKSTLINGYSVEKYIDENTPFFINNNHKPVVEIEKFAITIGSAGYHEFQIP